MTAKTIPADVLSAARDALAAEFERSVKAFPASPARARRGEMDHTYELKAIVRAILADRSTRPAEPAAPVAEGVRDTWFTDRALPVMAMSGDAESDRVLKLHFRRPVTDTDRQNLCDAMNLHQRSLNQVAEAGDGEVSRYIAKCREMSKGENGHTYTWWSRLADLLSTLEAERARADAAEQRAADALARAEKVEDWQPIETAPMGKNGVAFMMLSFGPPGDQTVSEGMHFNGRFYAASVFHLLGPSGGRQFAFREHEVRPTHWRPTLAPPRDLSQGGQHG